MPNSKNKTSDAVEQPREQNKNEQRSGMGANRRPVQVETVSRGSFVNKMSSCLFHWETLVMLLTVAPMAGFMAIQPYQQARRTELNCGAVCFGSMTSVSSFLGLIGAPLVGALSDILGRRFALALGCVSGALSFVIMGLSTSLLGLWLALIPSALFSHNFVITKAVVADLAVAEDRAGVLGKLGLAAGLGFMAGPIVSPFVTNYTQATIVATFLNLSSLFAVAFLPCDKSHASDSLPKQHSLFLGACCTVWEAMKEVFVLALSAPPAARVILFMRFGLSIGFHVFYTVMSVILKDKFKFGPSDYSNYFAFMGFIYAGAQLFSKRLINRYPGDPTWLIAGCTFLLMLGRLFTSLTNSIFVLYAALTASIAALGVLNNAINTLVTQVSRSGSVGGLMGVLDTAEKLAGVTGPALGGLLYAYSPLAPVVAVSAGYLTMVAVTLWAFPRFVVPVVKADLAAAKEAAGKQE